MRFSSKVLAVAAAGAITAAAALPANGAGAPGWRVVTTVGSSEGTWNSMITADSAKDAWSVWDAQGATILEHWAGSTWQAVKVPASVKPYVQNAAAIGASAATNVWLFDGPNTKIAQLSNGTWVQRSVPSWVEHINLSGDWDIVPEVFSTKNVWVFSLGQDRFTNPDHYVARYNGSTWSKFNIPIIPNQASVVSPTDIWVEGLPVNLASGKYLLSHWNGKSWTTVTVPTVTVPKGSAEFVTDLVATSPSNVWAVRGIENISTGAATFTLLHFNGKWSTVKLGYPTSWVNYVAQDGHGGIWLIANGPAPAYAWYAEDLNAGHWSRYSVPSVKGTAWSNVLGLYWIPGTQSMWATEQAGLPNNGGVYGAILKYGA